MRFSLAAGVGGEKTLKRLKRFFETSNYWLIRFDGITYSRSRRKKKGVPENCWREASGGAGKKEKSLEIRRMEKRKMVKLISRIKGIISCRRFSSDLTFGLLRLEGGVRGRMENERVKMV